MANHLKAITRTPKEANLDITGIMALVAKLIDAITSAIELVKSELGGR